MLSGSKTGCSRTNSVTRVDSDLGHMYSSSGMMKLLSCRICHRARSRSQRRRIMLWLATACLAMCIIYFNNIGLNMLKEQTNMLQMEDQPRKPRVVNPLPKNPVPQEEDSESDLMPDLAPAILHYIWCGRKVFEYRHYLALKSANRAVKPDKIFFHYEDLPLIDQEQYNQWFNQTLLEIDHLLPKPLNYTVCSQSRGPQRYLLVLDILEKFGGIYVPEASIWVDFPVHLRLGSLVSGVVPVSETQYGDGIIVAKKGGFKKPSTAEELLVVLSVNTQEHDSIRPCVSVEEYSQDETGKGICVRVDKPLSPKDIWTGMSKFVLLSRVIAYGVTQVRIKYNDKTPAPRIGHYVCIDCNLKFIAYLSMLSAIYVGGLNKVYIHGVERPKGIWWEKLKKDPRFIYVYREYPETIYDKAVMTPELARGIMRVGILLKYGGVYQDENALWTRKIPDEYFGYEAVASPDWHLYGNWPDSVNHGVVFSKRNSGYLLRLRYALSKYKNNQYWFNDHFMSYKIVENHPDLLKLDRHLQVKCLNHNCHPTWQENYRSGLMQNKPGTAFNWQNDTLTLHWTDTFPELDPDMVKYTSGIVIDASRNVLTSAGVDIQKL